METDTSSMSSNYSNEYRRLRKLTSQLDVLQQSVSCIQIYGCYLNN